MYVKHAYPSVIRNTPDLESSFLPKIPGAEENYGMLYNKPETEAEKKMNDLWLARRRQEVRLNLSHLKVYYNYKLFLFILGI